MGPMMGESAMKLQQIMQQWPNVREYLAEMPVELAEKFIFVHYAKGAFIQFKDSEVKRFGIVLEGSHRVINIFENGLVYMIERNNAISFIGEVALLCQYPITSVSIQTLTPCTVMYIDKRYFEPWIVKDPHFLRLLARDVARKLYRKSSEAGERLFYSARYIVLKYLVESYVPPVTRIDKTRKTICEEVGMSEKSFNRILSQFRDEGYLPLDRGKIVITTQEHHLGAKNLDRYIQENKNGFVS